jgi:hypothetical protein
MVIPSQTKESGAVRGEREPDAARPATGLPGSGVPDVDGVDAEDELLAAVRSRAARPMPPEVQSCLAGLLDQRRALCADGRRTLVAQVDTALHALLGPTPNLRLAKALARSARRASRPRLRILPLVTGLVLGLGLFSLAFHLLFRWWGPGDGFLGLDGQAQRDIAMVTLTGALGATVSVMLRARDHAAVRRIDGEALLFTGFSKPVVGASFALFVHLALHAGVITVSADARSQRFLLGALGFVAGFSERFAKDVISRVTSAAEGSPSAATGGAPPGDEPPALLRDAVRRTAPRRSRRPRSSVVAAGRSPDR